MHHLESSTVSYKFTSLPVTSQPFYPFSPAARVLMVTGRGLVHPTVTDYPMDVGFFGDDVPTPDGDVISATSIPVTVHSSDHSRKGPMFLMVMVFLWT